MCIIYFGNVGLLKFVGHSYVYWRRQLYVGHSGPLDLQQFIFPCTLTCTKSDSDYDVDSRLV